MLKVAPRPSKGRPKGDLGWIWERFGHNLGCFLSTFANVLCVIFACSWLLRMTGGFIKLLFLRALVCQNLSLVESFLLSRSHAFRRFPVPSATTGSGKRSPSGKLEVFESGPL